MCMLHANLPISQQHIQTPFFSLKPTNFRKSSKVVQTQSWLLVATLGKCFSHSCFHVAYHSPMQIIRAKQTQCPQCFCFHVAYHLPCIIQANQTKPNQRQCHMLLLPCGIPFTMHHPSKANTISHAFASMGHCLFSPLKIC